jgi:hypothetical protein
MQAQHRQMADRAEQAADSHKANDEAQRSGNGTGTAVDAPKTHEDAASRSGVLERGR